MKRIIGFLVILTVATPALADSDFCRGFELGYKTAKGNNAAFVPFCPFPPFTPFGSTPFQEGIKAGMKAANQD